MIVDPQLVRSAMQGDSASRCEVARRSHGWVFACCRSRVSCWHQAEELTQDILIRAIMGLKSLNAPEHYTSWLRGIAAHVCTDWHRRRKLSGMITLTDSLDLQASESEAPEALAGAFEESQRLHDELRRLPEELREVILLFHFEDLTYDQAAQWLDVSRATVSERLSKARDLLRVRLSGIGKAPV